MTMLAVYSSSQHGHGFMSANVYIVEFTVIALDVEIKLSKAAATLGVR